MNSIFATNDMGILSLVGLQRLGQRMAPAPSSQLVNKAEPLTIAKSMGDCQVQHDWFDRSYTE